MIDQSDKLFHCHKVKREVTIMEDYDTIDGKRTLVRSRCSAYDIEDRKRSCNGTTDHGFDCSQANYVYDKTR